MKPLLRFETNPRLSVLTLVSTLSIAACGETSGGGTTPGVAGDADAGGSDAGGSDAGGSDAGGGSGGDSGDGGAATSGMGGEGGGSGAAARYPTCRCTRQTDTDDVACPKGAGDTVETRIGPDGGKVGLKGQQGKASGVDFSLDFPPGSFADGSVVRISETSDAPPPGFVDFSPLYWVEAEASPAAAVAIVVPYGNRAGLLGSELSIYWMESEDGSVERIANSYVNAGFMQGSVREFGYFFAGYPVVDEDVCP